MSKSIPVLALLGTFLALTTSTTFAANDAVDKIHERGKLIVGVKADYKPYGFRDSSGKIVGLEPDLAKAFADRLGVKLELVPVVSSNRMQFLQQGKIDVMIATMNDRADRRKVVWVVDPDYYASGTNVLAPKAAHLTKWEDLKGKPVCGIQGAFYNKSVAQKYGADVVAFKSTPEVYTALKQGRCIGFLYDDSLIAAALADKTQWGDYEMPLQTIDEEPWGMAVQFGEYRLYGMLSEQIQKWLGNGTIVELEKKWGIDQSPPYVLEAAKKYPEWK